jgi:hypothetical protein
LTPFLLSRADLRGIDARRLRAVDNAIYYPNPCLEANGHNAVKQGGQTMYKQILGKITAHQELTEAEITELIAAINKGRISDVQNAGFQVALLMKGASQPASYAS